MVILTPVYNDWESLGELLRELAEVKPADATWEVYAVNDGSTDLPGRLNVPAGLSLQILHLSMNMGHQRAINIGLCYLMESRQDWDSVLIMDSDGEDRPQDIKDLRERFDGKGLVFADRRKRSEGPSFKAFYLVYKAAFKLLTGKAITFGNFSLVPRTAVKTMVQNADFWNHYPGAVLKSRLPFLSVRTERGIRYAGTSKMNFTNLIVHGLSSFSLYLDTIIVRMLMAAAGLILTAFGGMGLVLYMKYISKVAIPGWTSFLMAIILNILLTVSLFIFMIVLQHLNNRRQPPSRPLDYYKKFIEDVETWG
jgi:glycosyltransferase involved in cell wall biosynthesis